MSHNGEIDNEISTCSKKHNSYVNTQKRARTACKAEFTRFCNQLLELIEQTEYPMGDKVQSAHEKLKGSFDELVELSLNYSETLDAKRETSQSDKVLQDVEELTERFDKIEVQVRTRITEKKDESSAVDPGSSVASWVSQQQHESVAKTVQQVQLESLSTPPEIGRDMWRQLERVSVSKFNGNKHSYPSWKAAFNA